MLIATQIQSAGLPLNDLHLPISLLLCIRRQSFESRGSSNIHAEGF